MTVRWTVRAALTEERSKGEIKLSALRCRDEKSPLTRTKKSTSFDRGLSIFIFLSGIPSLIKFLINCFLFQKSLK